MICNKCGKNLSEDNGIVKEDYIRVMKEWGYFSKKDGTVQEFILCEDCADRLIEEMVVPPTVKSKTEWL